MIHLQLGFHADNNTLDVLLRPMTGLELSLEWPGCDWMENRLRVIRGTSTDNGPCEVKVEGTQDLHDPTTPPGVQSSPGSRATVRLEKSLVESRLKSTSCDPVRVTDAPIVPDSSSVARPLADARAKSDGDLIPSPRPPVGKNGCVGSMATPTRPRLIASARRPRYYNSEQPRAASVAASSVSSIGGEFFLVYCLFHVGYLEKYVLFYGLFHERSDIE